MAPEKPDMGSLYQEPDQAGLSRQSTFTFRCQAELPCFNQCCRTPTIILSPYDILRLQRALGITSGALLQRYTRQETEPLSNLPLVFIDACRPAGGGCPFLGAQGCSVYGHRPAACRLFPITMGSRLTPEGVVDHYFCRKLDYCRGFDTGVEWTLESWMANQGFGEYDQGRRGWIEILLKAGLLEPGAVDPVIQDLFATLAYDLDRCRRLAAEPAFREAYGLEEQEWQALRTDDLALLRCSCRVLESVLFEGGSGRLIEVIRGSKGFFEVD